MSAAELRRSHTALCPQVPELQKSTVRIQQPERVMGVIRAIKEQGCSKLQVRPACALLQLCCRRTSRGPGSFRGLTSCFPLMQAINISQSQNIALCAQQ